MATSDEDAPRGVLRDPEYQATLDRDGYVAVPLLTTDEMAELVAGYEALVPDREDGLTIDYVRDDRSTMSQVSKLLAPMFARHLPTWFHDYEPIVATFIVKHPGEASSMLMHHEPTYVDETRYRTFNIWIPLVEITWDPPNGGIQLVPGTESLCAPFCGLNTPVMFRPYESYLREHMVDVEVPVGSAIVYDTHMLHASGANLSDSPRPAIACALAPAEAPLLHTLATGRRTRNVYAVDRDFFIDTHPADLADSLRSSHELLERREIEFAIGPEDVATAIGATELPDPVCTPPDGLLESSGHRTGEVEPVDDRGRRARHDLGLTERAVELDGGTPRGVDLETGAFGRSSLNDDVRRLLESAEIDLGPGDDDAFLLTLDERRTGEISVDSSLAALRLEVLDCSEVAAGHLSRGEALRLVPGVTLDLLPGQHLIWNDGPGPLAMLTRPRPAEPAGAPTDRGRSGGLLSRLRSRRRR